MDKGPKFLYTIAKLIAPTHIHMGQTVITCITAHSCTHKAHFSQKLPNSGLEVAVMKPKKHWSTFYMDETGNFLLAKERNHMHMVEVTPEGKKISRGLITRFPYTKTGQLDSVNLGPGTVEKPNFGRNQYMTKKKQSLDLPKDFTEVAKSDEFLQEFDRLSKIEPEMVKQNLLNEKIVKIFQFECYDSQMAQTNIYGNDKPSEAFRELIKTQALEQINTGNCQPHHIVKIIKK